MLGEDAAEEEEKEGTCFAQKTHQTPSHQTATPGFRESLKIRPVQAECQLGLRPRGLATVHMHM